MTASEPRPEIMQLLQEAAAVEREACAKIADAVAARFRQYSPTVRNESRAELAEAIAAQIRARGQK